MTAISSERVALNQKVLEQYMNHFSSQNWPMWIELWADDGVLEFPFAPPGRRSRYVGKAAILDYMKPLGGRIEVEELEYFNLYPFRDEDSLCFEMAFKGKSTETGKPYNQKYISIVKIVDGKVALYREYWNPLASIDAAGGREAWTSNFGLPEVEESQS